jgi:hypothetical protein
LQIVLSTAWGTGGTRVRSDTESLVSGFSSFWFPIKHDPKTSNQQLETRNPEPELYSHLSATSGSMRAAFLAGR